MVRSSIVYSPQTDTSLVSAVSPSPLTRCLLFVFIGIAPVSEELHATQGEPRHVGMTSLVWNTKSIEDTRNALDPRDQEPQQQILSLAGRPKAAPVSDNFQTRSATLLVNAPQNKGEIRWLSGVITESETRLDPMKTAPRRLKAGRVSTYNAVLPRTTEYLKATGFGFEIPSTATIRGIQVHIEKRHSRLGAVQDTEVRLIKNGTLAGRNQAESGQWPRGGRTSVYGSSDDLWDLVLKPGDINAEVFGIAIAALLKPFDNFQIAEIGEIAISVYWE